jgi:hypothetical protein
MENSNPSSPAHFGLAGTFTPEDINELLGAMGGEHQPKSDVAASIASSSGFEGNDAADLKEDDGMDDGFKVQARSERKRSREKQRRCDVNMQFTDLTKLIRQLEAEEATDLEKARLAFSPTNRVDLIARTIVHLERLRDSNKRHKVEVDSLQQQLDQAKKAGEDTAAKLKEAMFNQPPQNKQVGYAQD